MSKRLRFLGKRWWECRMRVGVQRRKEGRRKTRVLGSGWNVVVALSF